MKKSIKIIGFIGLFISVVIYFGGKNKSSNYNSQSINHWNSYHCKDCQSLVQKLKTSEIAELNQNIYDVATVKGQFISSILHYNSIIELQGSEFFSKLKQNSNQQEQKQDQPENLNQIAIIMISIQSNLKNPADIFVGYGEKWIDAIEMCYELIYDYKKLETKQKRSKKDEKKTNINNKFQTFNTETIRIDFIGNIDSLEIQQIDQNTFQAKSHSRFSKVKYGLIIEGVILPVDLNMSPLLSDSKDKPESEIINSEYAQILVNNALLLQKEEQLKSIQNVITYQYQHSFVYNKCKQDPGFINSSLNHENQQSQQQQNSNIKTENIKNLRIYYPQDHQVSKPELEEFMKQSTEYLTTTFLQNADKFSYIFYPNLNEKNNRKYNLLRHAGTVYSLAQQYGRYRDSKVLETVKAGFKYLIEKKVVCPDTKINSFCFLDQQNKIKLGANGLSLLAFCEYQRNTGDTQYMDLMKGLARRIIEAQTPHGEFKKHIILTKTGEEKNTSVYYIGEAILGILNLYQFDPQQEYIDCAQKGINYIRQIQGFDHWLLYAINELDKYVQDYEVTAYAVRTCNEMYQKYGRFYKNQDIENNQNGSSVGTTVEGPLALYKMLKRNNLNPSFQKKILKMSNSMIKFHNHLQIKSYNVLFYPKPFRGIGGVRSYYYQDIVQIDNNQHQNSAQLAYLEILEQLELEKQQKQQQNNNTIQQET